MVKNCFKKHIVGFAALLLICSFLAGCFGAPSVADGSDTLESTEAQTTSPGAPEVDPQAAAKRAELEALIEDAPTLDEFKEMFPTAICEENETTYGLYVYVTLPDDATATFTFRRAPKNSEGVEEDLTKPLSLWKITAKSDILLPEYIGMTYSEMIENELVKVEYDDAVGAGRITLFYIYRRNFYYDIDYYFHGAYLQSNKNISINAYDDTVRRPQKYIIDVG